MTTKGKCWLKVVIFRDLTGEIKLLNSIRKIECILSVKKIDGSNIANCRGICTLLNIN